MKNVHIFEKETFNLVEIQKQAKINILKIVKESEDFYHNQIAEIAMDIANSNGQYKIVLMAGPSSSGKTTSSNLVREYLSRLGFESLVVSMDDFYVNRVDTPKLPDGSYDYENYTAIDLVYLNKFIDDLFEKKVAFMPKYNFAKGERERNYSRVELTDKTIIIIEGIHALNPIVFNNHIENMYKVYICLNTNFDNGENGVIPAQRIRLMRRMIRDFNNRGASLEDTFAMWKNVLIGEDLYIKPYKNTANYLLNSTHAYEPMLYSKYLKPMIDPNTDNELGKTLLKYFEHIEEMDKCVLPKDSLLHEFVD